MFAVMLSSHLEICVCLFSFLDRVPIDICILILVFNAAVGCHTIPPLFPQHVFRHYTYLRDTLPDLIPAIRVSIFSRKLRVFFETCFHILLCST